MMEDFKKIFNEEIDMTYFASGRVNLIGEHIDYNGGLVFPCAISQGTYASIHKCKDKKIRLASLNFKDKGIIEVDLSKTITYDEKQDWANYPLGVVALLQERGVEFDYGFDCLYEGNIPNGAGLSSSASINVVTARFISDLYGLNLSQKDIVLLTQAVENKFIGVNTGIMDQFAIAFGEKDHAILLQCDDLSYDLVPFRLENIDLVVMNTNKKRGLADSKYNERRSECERALAILHQDLKKDYLCDYSLDELVMHKERFGDDEIAYKRAYHCITENNRVREAKEVLQANDIVRFGELMNASHVSLRDDYDVTGIELDTLVKSAWEQDVCLGARVTGAGFGGCAIALVRHEGLEQFMTDVAAAYEEKIGYAADFMVTHAGQGVYRV